MATDAVSTAVASFAGLRGLAVVAGWPDRLAWLPPVTIDAYAMTSARVWLTDSRAQHDRAEIYARIGLQMQYRQEPERSWPKFDRQRSIMYLRCVRRSTQTNTPLRSAAGLTRRPTASNIYGHTGKLRGPTA